MQPCFPACDAHVLSLFHPLLLTRQVLVAEALSLPRTEERGLGTEAAGHVLLWKLVDKLLAGRAATGALSAYVEAGQGMRWVAAQLHSIVPFICS